MSFAGDGLVFSRTNPRIDGFLVRSLACRICVRAQPIHESPLPLPPRLGARHILRWFGTTGIMRVLLRIHPASRSFWKVFWRWSSWSLRVLRLYPYLPVPAGLIPWMTALAVILCFDLHGLTVQLSQINTEAPSSVTLTLEENLARVRARAWIV